MEKENKIAKSCFSETKEKYEAPYIEIVEVAVEQGVRMDPPDLDNPNNTSPVF